MKLRQSDIVSYQGKDLTVEGTVTYRLGNRTFKLARALEGGNVKWIEPLTDDLDDRILLLSEVRDIDLTIPPPATIAYRGKSFVPRFSGQAMVEIAGTVPDRSGTTCELWRYRAAGDLFLQIERWPERLVALFGESIHKDMVEVLPGS